MITLLSREIKKMVYYKHGAIINTHFVIVFLTLGII